MRLNGPLPDEGGIFLDELSGGGCAGPYRTDQDIARRVLGRDELDDVDPIAGQAQDGRAQRVRQHVGEPLAEDAMPGHQAVWRWGRGSPQLRLNVVMATRCSKDHRRLPADAARKRV